jgi:hypothetical protein
VSIVHTAIVVVMETNCLSSYYEICYILRENKFRLIKHLLPSKLISLVRHAVA